MEYATSRIQVVGDMVQQDVLQDFLGRLVVMLGNLLKGLVCGGKDCVVGLGAVKRLHNVVELIDPLCKLCSVFALVDELVDRAVRLLVVWRVVRSAMVWRSVMRRMIGVLEVNDAVVKLRAL